MKDYDIVRMMKNLFANRRHLKLVIFVMLQNYFALDKSLRELVDNVILFKMNKQEQIKIFNEVIESHKDIFDEIQHLVFNEPYQWLFVNIGSQRMFKKFDEMIVEYD
jgi:fructose-1-phosphate kinase PfkB-like protein